MNHKIEAAILLTLVFGLMVGGWLGWGLRGTGEDINPSPQSRRNLMDEWYEFYKKKMAETEQQYKDRYHPQVRIEELKQKISIHKNHIKNAKGVVERSEAELERLTPLLGNPIEVKPIEPISLGQWRDEAAEFSPTLHKAMKKEQDNAL